MWDLGLEIDLARVPLVQKMIMRKANARGVPVIKATQMLVRMVDNPPAPRAPKLQMWPMRFSKVSTPSCCPRRPPRGVIRWNPSK